MKKIRNMKKFFSIIFVATLLCTVGSAAAWGQTKHTDEEGIEYGIRISKTDDCYFNPWHLSEENPERENVASVTISLISSSGGVITAAEKTIELDLSTINLSNAVEFVTPIGSYTYDGSNLIKFTIPTGTSIGTITTNLSFKAIALAPNDASKSYTASASVTSGANGTNSIASTPLTVDISQAPAVLLPLQPEVNGSDVLLINGTPTIV
ncbi:MAG: hypothetical protein LBU92_04500, partial [Prevotellaceae bacterium]|nr:hypothetical protein [Prevotellaceae bacterium]